MSSRMSSQARSRPQAAITTSSKAAWLGSTWITGLTGEGPGAGCGRPKGKRCRCRTEAPFTGREEQNNRAWKSNTKAMFSERWTNELRRGGMCLPTTESGLRPALRSSRSAICGSPTHRQSPAFQGSEQPIMLPRAGRGGRRLVLICDSQIEGRREKADHRGRGPRASFAQTRLERMAVKVLLAVQATPFAIGAFCSLRIIPRSGT